MIDFRNLPKGAFQNLLAPYIVPLSGTWYRAIQLKFTATALQSDHTGAQTSRFAAGTPAKPVHQTLYFAVNQQVALLEVGAIFSPPGSGTVVANPSASWAVLNVTMSLNRIADLTGNQAQQDLETTAQELTGDWIGYQLRGLPGASVTTPTGIAPTQELGAALYRVPRLQGFLTLSAKAPNRVNLVVFPSKLKIHAKSSIQFTDPSTGKTHKIP